MKEKVREKDLHDMIVLAKLRKAQAALLRNHRQFTEARVQSALKRHRQRVIRPMSLFLIQS